MQTAWGPWFNRTRLWMNFVRILRPIQGLSIHSDVSGPWFKDQFSSLRYPSNMAGSKMDGKVGPFTWSLQRSEVHPTIWMQPEPSCGFRAIVSAAASAFAAGDDCRQSHRNRLVWLRPLIHVPFLRDYVSTWKESIQTAALKVGELEPS